MLSTLGPSLRISKEIYADKYLTDGESFSDAMYRIAAALSDHQNHQDHFFRLLCNQIFLPAGRIQSAIGSIRKTTPYNCFVSRKIEDSLDGIMVALHEAAKTMKLGGGIGYDFSTLRPSGARIETLDSKSSGPLSFMKMYDAMCSTISSAGSRRGAQMGVLRVDHPDIYQFVTAKTNNTEYTNFNLSVAVTNEFMEAVKSNSDFDLRFEGKVYETIKAQHLWNLIMECTWDWAEPGVLFIDKMNSKNNLHYAEEIRATNPCAEQPLPPFGACLLGSVNLVKYIRTDDGDRYFDHEALIHDIPHIVRAMDNVVDVSIYPLPAQEENAKQKRRMGIGVTGLANAVESLGCRYGDEIFKKHTSEILTNIRDTAYRTSIELAKEKGAFPLYNIAYLESDFAKTLPQDIRDAIGTHGIRNSHLLSIAPTGTISLAADNVSSGIEPVFAHSYDRDIIMPDGKRKERIEDYGVRMFGVKGKTAGETHVFEHVDVLNLVSGFVDSACSKTCNVSSDVSFEQFKDVYMRAYDGGASGCTTFRLDGKRFGMMSEAPGEEERDTEEEQSEDELFSDGAACYFDPQTGKKTCE